MVKRLRLAALLAVPALALIAIPSASAAPARVSISTPKTLQTPHYVLMPSQGSLANEIFQPSHALVPDVTTYTICNYDYGGCIYGAVSGKDVYVSVTTNDVFELANGSGSLACFGDTATCYEFRDTVTGLCIEYISQDNYYRGNTCYSNGGTIEMAEWFAWGPNPTDLSSNGAFDNGAGNGSGEQVCEQDGGNRLIYTCNDGDPGYLWSLITG